MSWRAVDLAADRSWHLEWDRRELSALDAWASVTRGEDPDELVAALAGAPEILVERAEAVRSELINGYGLVLLSGLDVGKYDRTSIAVMFMLFGSLIGSLRSQNAAGHLLGHVTDVGADVDDPATRIYQTNQRQTFHTDSTDAVGLLCLRTAKEGGVSMVVSVDAVYERLAAEAPKLAARLFEPIATDRRNEQPDGELPWFEIPVLSPSGDRGDGYLPTPVHRLGATFRGRAPSRRRNLAGTRRIRRDHERSDHALPDGPCAGRHAVRAQPFAVTRSHRFHRSRRS